MNNLSFYYCQNKPFLFGKGLFLGGTNKNTISELLIYPNPAQTEITIQNPTKMQTIEISNGLGQIVSKRIFNSKKSNLSISSLEIGYCILLFFDLKFKLQNNTMFVEKIKL